MLSSLWTLCLLARVLSVLSTNCPSGYQNTGETTCLQIYPHLFTRFEAQSHCETDGGNLVTPTNVFMNAEVTSSMKTVSALVWLGLVCHESDTSTCYTADGNQISGSTYKNFYPGHPDPAIGNCVYMPQNTSYWYSADCNIRLPFACFIDFSAGSSCGTGYVELNDNCYRVQPASIMDSSEAYCNLECGHLTSIHSEEENQLVYEMGLSTGQDYVRIGMQNANQNLWWWTDNSKIDFGRGLDTYVVSAMSMVMSLISDTNANATSWIQYNCSAKVPFICRRSKITPCASYIESFEMPCGEGTASHTNFSCPPVFYYDAGNITSPGWPRVMENQIIKCEYIIRVEEGQNVAFYMQTFPSFWGYTTYAIYADINDTTPMNDIPWNLGPHGAYTSSNNTMRITLESSPGQDSFTYFLANFYSYNLRQSGCNQTTLFHDGWITSPNFPANYFNAVTCDYAISTSAGLRIALEFTSFDTNNFDSVDVYDGPDVNSTLLGSFYDHLIPSLHPIPILNSSTNTMFIRFSTRTYVNTRPGFYAVFASFED